jgi:hypothetical protein
MSEWGEMERWRKLIKNLSATAESQAWGMLGVVLGFMIWSVWNKDGKPWLNQGQFCTISYLTAVSLYALISRTGTVLRNCLTSAQLLFMDEAITEAEYNKMRTKCLKKANAV